MTAELVEITPKYGPHRVVTVLEDILVRAKEGEFEAVIIVGLRTDSSFTIVSSPCRSLLEMIGALEIAKRDCGDRTVEGKP